MLKSATKTGVWLLALWFVMLRLGSLALRPFQAGFRANGIPIWFFVLLTGIHLVGFVGLALVVYGRLESW